MTEPLTIVPGKSDVEIAADLKRRATECLVPVAALMGEAHRAGMHLNFAIALDNFGRAVPTVGVIKPLA